MSNLKRYTTQYSKGGLVYSGPSILAFSWKDAIKKVQIHNQEAVDKLALIEEQTHGRE